MFLLMIINNFDVRWAGCISRPFKTNTPLVVDADAVLSFTITLQCFKTITRQRGEISKLGGRFQTVKFQTGSAVKARKRADSLTGCEVSCPLVPVADNYKLR
jgi:hypothetical protein